MSRWRLALNLCTIGAFCFTRDHTRDTTGNSGIVPGFPAKQTEERET